MLVIYIFRDPDLNPFKCTTIPPCQKLFSSEKSEKEHRRSGRCKTFMCSKCGDKFKEKSIKEAHDKICQEIFSEPRTDAAVVGEIDIDAGIDIDVGIDFNAGMDLDAGIEILNQVDSLMDLSDTSFANLESIIFKP